LREYDSARDYEGYLHHLTGRSLLGLIYRRFWLYPKLTSQVSGRVLDVGCGIGDFLAYRPETVGIDINPLLVQLCRERGLDARLMEQGSIPFPDSSFDSIVLDNVLEHLAEPASLLAEIRRVLVPGGTFLVGVPGVRGYASHSDHKVFYDEQALAEVLTGAGFKQVRIFQMPLRSDWLDARMRQYCVYGVFRRSA
jgi:SAM-dependent methyltransferase